MHPLALGISAVVLAACGSTPPRSVAQAHHPASRPPPAGRGRPVAVLTIATGSTPTVTVGDLVEVELASHAYRRDGSIVPWSTPTSSRPSVAAATRAPAGATCPPGSTCTYFVGRAPGDTTIVALGPSGVLCDQQGASCVGVTAVARPFPIHVVAH